MKKKNYCPPDVEKGVKWVKRMFRRLNKEGIEEVFDIIQNFKTQYYPIDKNVVILSMYVVILRSCIKSITSYNGKLNMQKL